MSKIEFRIWHKIHQRMYENIYEINFYNSRVGYIIDDYSVPEQRIEDVSFDDCVIMQFTGSTGKNGTKIFEGDLFNFNRAGLYEVIFSRQYGFIMRSLSNPNHWVSVAHYKHLEAVGNIHEREQHENK